MARTYTIKVRLSWEEFTDVQTKAEKANMGLSPYIRKVLKEHPK